MTPPDRLPHPVLRRRGRPAAPRTTHAHRDVSSSHAHDTDIAVERRPCERLVHKIRDHRDGQRLSARIRFPSWCLVMVFGRRCRCRGRAPDQISRDSQPQVELPFQRPIAAHSHRASSSPRRSTVVPRSRLEHLRRFEPSGQSRFSRAWRQTHEPPVFRGVGRKSDGRFGSKWGSRGIFTDRESPTDPEHRAAWWS